MPKVPYGFKCRSFSVVLSSNGVIVPGESDQPLRKSFVPTLETSDTVGALSGARSEPRAGRNSLPRAIGQKPEEKLPLARATLLRRSSPHVQRCTHHSSLPRRRRTVPPTHEQTPAHPGDASRSRRSRRQPPPCRSLPTFDRPSPRSPVPTASRRRDAPSPRPRAIGRHRRRDATAT